MYLSELGDYLSTHGKLCRMMLNTFTLFIDWRISPFIIPGSEFLRWYGLLWAIGLGLGYYVLKKIWLKEGKSAEALDKLGFYLIIGIIVGARLGHVLFYDWAYYQHHLLEAILPFSFNPFRFTGYLGLASHGGVIGTLLAVGIFNYRYKLGFIWLLDRLIVPSAIIACCIRLGNLMNSEIIGTPTDLPWGFVFHQIDQIPRHPAQLYEALAYAFTFIITYRLWKSHRHESNGLIVGAGLLIIFGFRFIVEFFKENQSAFEDGLFLNMGQVLSIPMIILSIILLVYHYRSRQPNHQPS